MNGPHRRAPVPAPQPALTALAATPVLGVNLANTTLLRLDQGGGLTRRALVDRRDRGEEVADAADLLTDGDEARPVLEDEPVPALAGHVGWWDVFEGGVYFVASDDPDLDDGLWYLSPAALGSS